MPKVIDYADRFEALREVVYEITLEEGQRPSASTPFAARLYMSSRTIQRLIASAGALPLLGVQRAESSERKRFLHRQHYASWTSRPRSERALEKVLEEIPGLDATVDRHVWWTLVLAHTATTEWARAAHLRREELLATWCDEVLTDLADAEARAREARRLHFLVTGAIAHACLGIATHDDAADEIRCHVGAVLATKARCDAA